MKLKCRSIVVGLSVFCGLALLLLILGPISSISADPGIIYVAPDANCSGMNPCYGSVQEAVDAAIEGDEIRVATGIYTDISARAGTTQVVYISKTVTIQGGYTTLNWTTPDPNANPTTLDAQGQGRVLLILGEVTPTVEGLRITGGNASFGGGVAVGFGAVILKNNQVLSNTAEGSGGGLYLETGVGATVISGNTFAYNASGNCGGGMTLGTYLAPATVSDNTVSSNIAEIGGGICGGGTLVTYTTNLIGRNTIVSNTASTYGGGVWLEHSADILKGNIIVGNIADSGGGLGLMYRGNTTLVNNVVADNQANKGSGLYVLRFTPHLSHNTISHNNDGDGIGIYIAEDLVEMEPSIVTLTNNILVSHTVGISITAGSTATVNGILWHDNTLDYEGPGIIAATNEFTGSPAFVSDGYHITFTSAALDVGIPTNVTSDIDENTRPLGVAPDLGADEINAAVLLAGTDSQVIFVDPDGNTTTLNVPAGAVTETLTLIYTPIATATGPISLTFAGRAFTLEPYRNGVLLDTLSFGPAATITLHYSNANVVGMDERKLYLYTKNNDVWEDAACGDYERHPDENWLAVPICHLSKFALFGETSSQAVATITKTAIPTGQVNYGEEISYTLLISATSGTELALYDLLEGTSWVRFVGQRPTGITYANGAIVGTLEITPTNQITVSFVVEVGVPGTLGWTVDVTNRACVYPLGGKLDDCVWSNEVTNPAFRPYEIFLPLVMRNS